MRVKKPVARRRTIPKDTKHESGITNQDKKDAIGIVNEAEDQIQVSEPVITTDTVIVEETVKTFQDEVADQPRKMKKFSISKHLIMYSTVSLLLIISVAAAGYFFLEYQKSQKLLKDPSLAGNKELTQTRDKIAKLIDLPVNEQPTIATVSDINKLKGQAFFEKAQNGDKVLIYTSAKKAYLYRPSVNRLIDVAPVSFPSPQPTVAGASIAPVVTGTVTPSPSETVSEEIKVALYNGSGVTGITRSAEEKLTASVENTVVIARENANKRDYTQTLVVDISGKKKGVADNLISALGVGKVGTLPADEIKPTDTDFLIILGTDYKE